MARGIVLDSHHQLILRSRSFFLARTTNGRPVVITIGLQLSARTTATKDPALANLLSRNLFLKLNLLPKHWRKRIDDLVIGWRAFGV